MQLRRSVLFGISGVSPSVAALGLPVAALGLSVAALGLSAAARGSCGSSGQNRHHRGQAAPPPGKDTPRGYALITIYDG